MDGAQQSAQQQQQPQQGAPPAQSPRAPSSSTADAHKQPHVQPVRSFLPSASLAAAEKSLFPNSMPVRQLPGIHSFAPSSAGGAASPPGPPAPGKASSPPGSAGGAGSPMGLTAGQARPAGGEQKRFGAGSVSPYGAMPSRSPNPPPPSSAAPNTHTTPTPPIIPGPASGLSPPLPAASAGPIQRSLPSLTSPVPPSAPGGSAVSPPPHQPAPPTSSAGATAARTAGNPMSVSSMLSGPPRDRPVSAYSPVTNAGGAAAAMTAGRAGSPPQPPVLPPASTAGGGAGDGTRKSPQMQRQQAQGVPVTQPGTTLPAYVAASAPNAAPSTKAIAEPAPSSALGSARSSYPPLPSAFARENPYSPSTASGATSGTATPAPNKAHAAAGSNVQLPQQHQRDAAAVEVKKSLFPALGLGGAGIYGRPGPGAGAPVSAGRTTGAQQAGAGSSTPGQPYPWQAQAAQQAQQVLAAQQQQQQQQAGGRKTASSRPGATTSVSAPAAPTVGAGRGGQAASGAKGTAAGKAPQQYQHQQPPHQQQRYPPPPALEPYGGARNVQPTSASSAPTPSHAVPTHLPVNGTPATKRRRSDASEQQQATAAPARRHKSATPPPLAPPLFTHIELRKAMIQPPVVEVLNGAVDEWAKNALKEVDGERRFLGRVTYDALVSPAKLLDGGLLARGVGGYVEVVVPTTWILGPHRPSAPQAADLPIRSSCSVPPIDLHPVVFDVGPPSAYNGEPLPFTLSMTPLLLPPHLADLPAIRKREVWGTDVYTDDSDVLAMLLHSGWLRVTRRERRVKAGEKGAGADAIRRARIPGEERVVLPPTDGEEKGVPKALCVKLGVVPALVQYEGIERQGIRSRSWGNGHDGVSLRIEEVKPLDEVPPEPVLRTRKSRAASCAHQCAELYYQQQLHDDDHASSVPPAKRYRFSSDSPALVNGDGPAADQGEVLLSDTFVIDALSGRGTFVGLQDEDGRGAGFERDEGEARMEVEAAA